MRWLSKVLVILLAIPAYAGENEAEKLFRQMEKKLNGAKSIKVQCESTMKTSKKGASVKLTSNFTVVFGENNKAFLEGEGGDFGDQGGKSVIISNGKKFYTGYKGVRDMPLQDSPKNMGTYGRAALARGWSQHALVESLTIALAAEARHEQLPDDFWKMSNFKLGAKEKIGKAETRIIEYTFVEPGQEKIRYDVKVWIDTQTHLPVKQELRAQIDGVALEVTDTFAEFIVDGKVDAKLFELPQ